MLTCSSEFSLLLGSDGFVFPIQRQKLFEMAGAGQTPYLIDPNTGAKGYESSEIVDYLEETYAL